MCFIDTNGMSRRGFLSGSLVAGAAAAASLGRSLGLPGAAEGAEAAPAGAPGMPITEKGRFAFTDWKAACEGSATPSFFSTSAKASSSDGTPLEPLTIIRYFM